jgi:hypothetical protein
LTQKHSSRAEACHCSHKPACFPTTLCLALSLRRLAFPGGISARIAYAADFREAPVPIRLIRRAHPRVVGDVLGLLQHFTGAVTSVMLCPLVQALSLNGIAADVRLTSTILPWLRFAGEGPEALLQGGFLAAWIDARRTAAWRIKAGPLCKGETLNASTP